MDDSKLNPELSQSVNKIRNNLKTKLEEESKIKIESDRKKIHEEFVQLSNKHTRILRVSAGLLVASIVIIGILLDYNKKNTANKYETTAILLPNNFSKNETSTLQNEYQENTLNKAEENESEVVEESGKETMEDKYVFVKFLPHKKPEIIKTYQNSLLSCNYNDYVNTVGSDYAVDKSKFENKCDTYDLGIASMFTIKYMDNYLIKVVDNNENSHFLVEVNKQLHYMEYPIIGKIEYPIDLDETDVYKSVEDSFDLLKADDFDINKCLDVYSSYPIDKYYVNAASEEGRVKQIENIIANSNDDISDKFWPFLFEYYYTVEKDYDKAIYAAESTKNKNDLEERISNMRVAFSWYCKGEVLKAIEILSLYPDNYIYANEMLIMDKESFLKQNNQHILTVMGNPYIIEIDYIIEKYYMSVFEEIEEGNQEEEVANQGEVAVENQEVWDIASTILYTDQTIAVDVANFREGPSVESNKLGTIDKGNRFYIEGVDVDDDGEIWCYFGASDEDSGNLTYGWSIYTNFQE